MYTIRAVRFLTKNGSWSSPSLPLGDKASATEGDEVRASNGADLQAQRMPRPSHSCLIFCIYSVEIITCHELKLHRIITKYCVLKVDFTTH